MPYKGAFDCASCPRTADPLAKRACPAWWEVQWTDGAGQHDERSCAFVQLPHLLNFLAREARTAAASAQEARNFSDDVRSEIQRGFRALALATNAGLEDVKAAIVPSSSTAARVRGTRTTVRSNPTESQSHIGSSQQPGCGDDGAAPDSGTCYGAVLLRHYPGEADMVQQLDFHLEGRNGH